MVDLSHGHAEPLSVGKKIRLLRRHARLPIEEFAEIIAIRKDTVSKIENDNGEYTAKHMEAIRKYFDIAGMPLTEYECMVNKESHYRWLALIKAGKMDEAKAVCKDLANIVNLEPCDPDAVMRYRMLEAQMFIADKQYIAAEEKLNLPQDVIDRMSNENLYHYYFNKGYLHTSNERYADGIGFLEKAWKLVIEYENLLPEEDELLYFYMGLCYSYIEMPFRAIYFLNKCRDKFFESIIWNFKLGKNCALALNYAKLNQFDEAGKLLDTCLIIAKSMRQGYCVGSVMFIYGYMHTMAENWTTAIEYFDTAIEILYKGLDHYYASYFHKIICITKTRAFSKARTELEKVEAICGTDEVWSIYFKSLWQYIAVSSRMSRQNHIEIYNIQNVFIPYFIKHHDYYIAIEYYKLLRQHFKRCRSAENAYQMAEKILELYERCLISHVSYMPDRHMNYI